MADYELKVNGNVTTSSDEAESALLSYAKALQKALDEQKEKSVIELVMRPDNKLMRVTLEFILTEEPCSVS